MAEARSFHEQEKKFTGRYEKSLFQTLQKAYSPFKWTALLCIACGLTGRVLLLGNANVIGKWVDQIGRTGFTDESSKTYLLSLLAMTSVGLILTILFRVGFSRLSAKAVSQIYDEVTMRSSRFPMVFFDRTPVGRVITRFSSDYGNVFRLFGGPLAEFISIVFDLLVMLTLLAIASPIYLPLVLLMGVANYFVWKANRDPLREARRQLSLSRSPSIAHFSETAFGSSTIRSFNKSPIFAKRFRRLDSDYLSHRLNTTRAVIGYSFKMNSLTALLLLSTGISAYFWLKNGWVTVGSLGVALGFITLSGTTVQMFFEWMAQFEEALVGMERLDQYLRMPIEKGAFLPSHSQIDTGHPKKSEATRGPTERPLAARVEFKNVWFRYQNELPFVLRGIQLNIAPGERVGIVGRTGSGKSSLIQALFHLYPLSEGQICIDGRSPSFSVNTQEGGRQSLEDFRHSMAFISQESVLFKGTLRDNLDIEGKLADAPLLNALHRVGLTEWAHADQLQMAIEEKGRNLSLGEKQLICMARCLLQQTPVVIMDEATSSVDPQSEEILVRATDEFFAGRTQIIIAHRLSTLLKCDRIVWIHQGQIKMIGPTQEVLPIFTAQEADSVL